MARALPERPDTLLHLEQLALGRAQLGFELVLVRAGRPADADVAAVEKGLVVLVVLVEDGLRTSIEAGQLYLSLSLVRFSPEFCSWELRTARRTSTSE